MIEFSQSAMERYKKILRRYPAKRPALIPVLILAQREFGYISQEVAEYVGELMGYAAADVLSVATFYTLLRKKPVGKYHLEICRNVSCWMRGANDCMEEAHRLLGVAADELTADKKFSWNFTECLASCGTAPAMQVGDRYYENLTPQSLGEIIEKLKNE
jgi:NADH-quinone oxidoreductase E subunit